jgi:hypothetical protein
MDIFQKHSYNFYNSYNKFLLPLFPSSAIISIEDGNELQNETEFWGYCSGLPIFKFFGITIFTHFGFNLFNLVIGGFFENVHQSTSPPLKSLEPIEPGKGLEPIEPGKGLEPILSIEVGKEVGKTGSGFFVQLFFAIGIGAILLSIAYQKLTRPPHALPNQNHNDPPIVYVHNYNPLKFVANRTVLVGKTVGNGAVLVGKTVGKVAVTGFSQTIKVVNGARLLTIKGAVVTTKGIGNFGKRVLRPLTRNTAVAHPLGIQAAPVPMAAAHIAPGDVPGSLLNPYTREERLRLAADAARARNRRAYRALTAIPTALRATASGAVEIAPIPFPPYSVSPGSLFWCSSFLMDFIHYQMDPVFYATEYGKTEDFYAQNAENYKAIIDDNLQDASNAVARLQSTIARLQHCVRNPLIHHAIDMTDHVVYYLYEAYHARNDFVGMRYSNAAVNPDAPVICDAAIRAREATRVLKNEIQQATVAVNDALRTKPLREAETPQARTHTDMDIYPLKRTISK